MKTTGLGLLVASVFACSAMSQTISGYIDSVPPANSHHKTNWLEYQGIPLGGLQATLRLSTNTFQVGTNIEAEIVFKNVSTNAINFSEAWPLLANGLSVKILDKDKAEIPLTSFGKAQKTSGSASPNVSHRLQPGKEIAAPLELRKLYQLDSPGVYSIQATRSLSSPEGRKLVLATGIARIAIEAPTSQRKN